MIERYLPGSPWPAYAYLPGRDPHPVRDPAGHLHGSADRWGGAPDPAKWETSAGYLRGTDLYNHGFHWEAHEVWEELWHEPRDTVQGEFLRALIQAAAAALQERMGHPDGRRRLATRATERLQEVASSRGPWYMGVDLSVFSRELGAYARAESPPDGTHLDPPRLRLRTRPGNPPGPIG